MLVFFGIFISTTFGNIIHFQFINDITFDDSFRDINISDDIITVGDLKEKIFDTMEAEILGYIGDDERIQYCIFIDDDSILDEKMHVTDILHKIVKIEKRMSRNEIRIQVILINGDFNTDDWLFDDLYDSDHIIDLKQAIKERWQYRFEVQKLVPFNGEENNALGDYIELRNYVDSGLQLIISKPIIMAVHCYFAKLVSNDESDYIDINPGWNDINEIKQFIVTKYLDNSVGLDNILFLKSNKDDIDLNIHNNDDIYDNLYLVDDFKSLAIKDMNPENIDEDNYVFVLLVNDSDKQKLHELFMYKQQHILSIKKKKELNKLVLNGIKYSLVHRIQWLTRNIDEPNAMEIMLLSAVKSHIDDIQKSMILLDNNNMIYGLLFFAFMISVIYYFSLHY